MATMEKPCLTTHATNQNMTAIVTSDSDGDASVNTSADETVHTILPYKSSFIEINKCDLPVITETNFIMNRTFRTRLPGSAVGSNTILNNTTTTIRPMETIIDINKTQHKQTNPSSPHPNEGKICNEGLKTTERRPNPLIWERPTSKSVPSGNPLPTKKRVRESLIIDLTDDQSDEGDCSQVEKDEWIDWSDQSQVQFGEIERISVYDFDVTKRVTEHRRNGVPVVLTNHVGWAQFAKGWIIPVEEKVQESTASRTDESNSHGVENSNVRHSVDSMIDLCKPHKLNLQQIITDIGSEEVPVLPRQYDEYNPTKNKMPVEEYIYQAWPDMVDERKQQLCAIDTTCLPWYMHQWQFPLSPNKDVVSMLCGQGKNNPLPNNILGDDLLSYWLDKEKCNCDSPYQYLFMGREDTKSKLHRDAGGLVITIAPIVGLKEVVLVHRDNESKLYNMEIDVDNVNLDSFPMLYDIRAWKSVIKPGEILIMPEGTYHQCRNVTPCFSYHRFYLDTVNLPSFLDSFYKNDAKEISHDEVIWNAAHALMRRVDNHVEFIRVAKTYSIGTSTELPEKIKDAVHNLRILRNVSREVYVRVNAKMRIRGQTQSLERESNHWDGLVGDIDETLHAFRYRCEKEPPQFVPKSISRNQVSKKQRQVEE